MAAWAAVAAATAKLTGCGEALAPRPVTNAVALELGAGVSVEAPVPSARVAGDQRAFVVNLDGPNPVAAWEDYRGSTAEADIYLARFTAAGLTLDPGGLPVCLNPGHQRSPRLAFDGTTHLVAWIDSRDGVDQVFGARLMQGALLEPNGVRLTNAPSSVRSMSLDFDGTRFVLAWSDAARDSFVLRLTPGLGPADPAPRQVATTAAAEDAATVACRSGRCLVAWLQPGTPHRVLGRRYDEAWAPLDTAPLAIVEEPLGLQDLGAAAGTSNFLVTWTGLLTPGAASYSNTVAVATGAVLPDAGSQLVPVTDVLSPRPVATAAGFTVAFQPDDGNSIAARTFDAAGQPLSAPVFLRSNSQTGELGFDCTAAGDCLAAWAEPLGSVTEPFFARLSATGQSLDDGGTTPLSSVNAQWNPAAAFNGAHWLVVWEDDRSGDRDLYGVRVDPGGAVVDGAARLIASGPGDQQEPAVAALGSDWLVAWSGGRHQPLQARRVGASGALLEPAPLTLATESSLSQYLERPAVAAADDWAVVFSAGPSGQADLYGVRVSAAGVVLTPAPVLLQQAIERGPALDFNGSHHLLAWVKYHPSSRSDVWVALMTGALSLVTGPVVLDDSPGHQQNVEVAHRGTQFAVAWTNEGRELRARRVSGAGTPLDLALTIIPSTPRGPGRPSLADDGTDYLVAWTALRDGAPYDLDLFQARLLAAAAPASLSSEPFPEESVVLSPGPTGRVLVVYVARPAAVAPTARVMVRALADVPPGGACQRSAECRGGASCVGFVCCSTDCSPDGGAQGLHLRVGCGCGTPPPSLSLLAVGLLLARRPWGRPGSFRARQAPRVGGERPAPPSPR